MTIRLTRLFLGCCSVFLFPFNSWSQYILNGSATQESCNCYLLTRDELWQGGSVWQSTKIDLRNSFDFSFNIYPGCRDADGADGIAFILQPVSTSLGVAGGGMGFSGVSPSIGVVVDSWKNVEDNDPDYDHISIQANGVIVHGNDLAGPVPASSTSNNVEDCNWHVLRIKWDAVTHTISTYFDGTLRLSAVTDLVTTIFRNDPMVYWGFSAATGGDGNLQKFCTALNPVFNSGLANDNVCLGTPVSFTDNSTSFTTIKSYHWDFGDGTSSTLANPPPHAYAKPGVYKVTHSITAMDNCESEPFTRMVTVGDNPVLSLVLFDTCETKVPRVKINATADIGTINHWKWELDGTPFSLLEKPDFSKLPVGNHSITLQVASDIGCFSDVSTTTINIKKVPEISFETKDGCADSTVSFSGEQKDLLTTINSWQWDFGKGIISNKKDTRFIFPEVGYYPVQLEAFATNGCESIFTKNIFINMAHADAGKDTLVIPDTFFQLNGSGGTSYSWSPATGLSNPGIPNPMGNVSDDINYLLTVKTAEGCTDTASVKVTTFKGSALYVPTAFTPNRDGLNDLLKPYYVGIKALSYFIVYNNWGQKVFSTNDMTKGWDGYFKGKECTTGSYVWVLKALDVDGKPYNLKGTFVLIK
ncbi:MAG: PKD domain-containing protein [Ginsengibacter sp.]